MTRYELGHAKTADFAESARLSGDEFAFITQSTLTGSVTKYFSILTPSASTVVVFTNYEFEGPSQVYLTLTEGTLSSSGASITRSIASGSALGVMNTNLGSTKGPKTYLGDNPTFLEAGISGSNILGFTSSYNQVMACRILSGTQIPFSQPVVLKPQTNYEVKVVNQGLDDNSFNIGFRWVELPKV